MTLPTLKDVVEKSLGLSIFPSLGLVTNKSIYLYLPPVIGPSVPVIYRKTVVVGFFWFFLSY